MALQPISMLTARSVLVASVAISGKEEAQQAEQWEVGYIFPATELLSFYGWYRENKLHI